MFMSYEHIQFRWQSKAHTLSFSMLVISDRREWITLKSHTFVFDFKMVNALRWDFWFKKTSNAEFSDDLAPNLTICNVWNTSKQTFKKDLKQHKNQKKQDLPSCLGTGIYQQEFWKDG